MASVDTTEPVLVIRGAVARAPEKIFEKRLGELEQSLMKQARQRLGPRRAADACCHFDVHEGRAGVTLVCRVYAPASARPRHLSLVVPL